MKKILICILVLFLYPKPGWAEIKTKTVDYSYGGVAMKGYLAWDDAVQGRRPGVLVVHEWWGLNAYAKRRAEQLAGLGYVALAADIYGGGRSTEHPEEAQAMADEARKDPKVWLGRAEAALKILRSQPEVDPERLAAIGYCFGGATVLQMAYHGADLKAVVSFHGTLPIPESTRDIKARILILQGAEDPFVSQEDIHKLKTALEQGKVHYRWVTYPGAVHSFTVPEADQRNMKGIAYNAEADRLSWLEMLRLFKEVLGPLKTTP